MLDSHSFFVIKCQKVNDEVEALRSSSDGRDFGIGNSNSDDTVETSSCLDMRPASKPLRRRANSRWYSPTPFPNPVKKKKIDF